MGPSVKFVSPNKGLISKKKNGGQFFSCEKWPNRGGSEGGLAKDHTFSRFFFWTLPLTEEGNKLVNSPIRWKKATKMWTMLQTWTPKKQVSNDSATKLGN